MSTIIGLHVSMDCQLDDCYDLGDAMDILQGLRFRHRLVLRLRGLLQQSNLVTELAGLEKKWSCCRERLGRSRLCAGSAGSVAFPVCLTLETEYRWRENLRAQHAFHNSIVIILQAPFFKSWE